LDILMVVNFTPRTPANSIFRHFFKNLLKRNCGAEYFLGKALYRWRALGLDVNVLDILVHSSAAYWGGIESLLSRFSRH